MTTGWAVAVAPAVAGAVVVAARGGEVLAVLMTAPVGGGCWGVQRLRGGDGPGIRRHVEGLRDMDHARRLLSESPGVDAGGSGKFA